MGRETAIQKLYWKDGWPYVKGGKEGSLEVDAPSIPETMFEDTYPEVDEFEDATLNINFQTLRIPFTEKLGSLTQVPNHLRLYGHESLTSTFTQAFVARRWQSLHLLFIIRDLKSRPVLCIVIVHQTSGLLKIFRIKRNSRFGFKMETLPASGYKCLSKCRS